MPGALAPLVEIAETTGGKLEQLVREAARPEELAAALLRELAPPPAVLVLEDVHWADEATLDVLTRSGSSSARPRRTIPSAASTSHRSRRPRSLG